MGGTRVAVTGASGFIGRHVLAELERRQVDAVAVTRHRERLEDTATPAASVELDIGDADDGTFERLGRPGILIHLAWGGLPNYRSPHHLESELPRQLRFLTALVESGLESLLVTGTCFEYGMQSGRLTEDQTTHPDNPYGCAKDELRRALERLRERRGFSLTWARLFYLYGSGQAPSSLYAQLRAAVANGHARFDMSGGEQIRDYLPVAAAAKLLVSLALDHPDSGCVNVCSGEPVRIRDLVGRWLDENAWSIELNTGHFPYPDYEPMEFWGDRRKLDRLLRGET